MGLLRNLVRTITKHNPAAKFLVKHSPIGKRAFGQYLKDPVGPDLAAQRAAEQAAEQARLEKLAAERAANIFAQNAAAQQRTVAANQAAISNLASLNRQQQTIDSAASAATKPAAPTVLPYNAGQSKIAQTTPTPGMGPGAALMASSAGGAPSTNTANQIQPLPQTLQGFQMPSMSGITFGGA